MSEFADTNSFGDKFTIIYSCHKENASYEKKTDYCSCFSSTVPGDLLQKANMQTAHIATPEKHGQL